MLAASAGTGGLPPAVSGQVRDTQGVPQAGALVELLRPDASVVARVFTDQNGRYAVPRVLPGIYGIKVTGTLFLPTLRENLRIAANSRMVIDLTLNTLFEAFHWLPVQRRTPDEAHDDWAWTLRSSANRPLLRMLEDGPLVLVSDGAEGARPVLKARVMMRGGDNSFGDGGLHHAFELERSRDADHELILRADLGEQDGASVGASMGYEQQLGAGQTVRTVASFSQRPQIESGESGGGRQGLQSLRLRTAQTMQLTNSIDAQAGNEMEAVRLGKTLVASHPFAGIEWHQGDVSLAYNLATSRGVQDADSLDVADMSTPAVSEQNGVLQLEHGLHQSVALREYHDHVRVQMIFYRDRIDNQVVNGGGTISQAAWSTGDLMYDPGTELMRVAAGDYSTEGMVAEVHDRLMKDTWVSVAYADGGAVAFNAQTAPVSLETALANLKPERAQSYSVAFNGKLHTTGAQWRASYRWQPAKTVSPVAPYEASLPDAYVSIYLRQPIHYHHIFPQGMEALIDVRNLLAQGYRPFVTTDGSTLYFAQADRSIQGGLSFSF